jgi:hypothetical protein
MGVGGQRHSPAALLPGKDPKTRYPLYKRLGGPQSRSGQVQKISPPPEFDPRTVQYVASRYTDYAIPSPPYKGYWVTFPGSKLPGCVQDHLPPSSAVVGYR